MPARLHAAAMAATRRDADTLGALVVEPILDLIGDRDLVVVPTGALAAVPWRLLRGCAERPVTVAPSATVWSAARDRRRDRASAPAGGDLLVAGPGNAQGEAEVRAIAALRPGATVLAGAAATPAATLTGLDGADLAHLAAHGHHEPENALFSSLDLAGGPLMGYDVQRLARPPATVVLSSCDLGLADVRPGDEALGMATALIGAGSATVIASVSRVSDDTAIAVMTGYHRAAGCAAPAAALAEASAKEELSSFVCFGSG
jgi:CHAT domain-containing protein